MDEWRRMGQTEIRATPRGSAAVISGKVEERQGKQNEERQQLQQLSKAASDLLILLLLPRPLLLRSTTPSPLPGHAAMERKARSAHPAGIYSKSWSAHPHPSHSSLSSKEGIEYVLRIDFLTVEVHIATTHPTGESTTTTTTSAIVRIFLPVPIVYGPLLRIGQGGIRQPDSLEGLVGMRGGILIGMELERQLPVGLLDLRVVGIGLDFQNAIMRPTAALLGS
mmetsp:Transcript_21208/g.43441  ORF Transcript_21208/g.43441 Transcript_21208/m.43441 type:complete len:223 (+) Transcript_21208:1910-2578(+)